ncbi:MAG: Vi polysaccharide biosynthesis protein VipB/TviC, partial [Candidatus Altiarchaeales archaeon WOR_SM1_79]
MKECILITGGAGFIGSNIAHRLLEEYYNVKIIDNFSTGSKKNIENIIEKVEFVRGDVRDMKLLKSIMEGVDYVLHQAAIPSVQRSINDPVSSNDANVNGTLNVLVAAKDTGVKRVVYASSSSVYGDTPTLPKKEDMVPGPKSPYAITKLTAEYYCKIFYEIYGLETVSLRYFNVFGPGQDPKSEYSAVIPKFITALLKDKQPTIYGDGLQTRDFSYIENVVDANILACKAKNASGKIFNIACGERISLNEIV